MSLEKFDLQSILADANRFHYEQAGLGFDAEVLQHGLSCGVTRLSLKCHDIQVAVLPTRGMGIWEAHRRGVRFGWDSPVSGPVHPAFVPLTEPSGLGWLDGFDELMVRCGLSNNGAPQFDSQGKLIWPLHGRIANLPGKDVEVAIDHQAGRIQISGAVQETRFLFHHWRLDTTLSLCADSAEIQITDRVTNLSSQPGSIQILYHCNFGLPLLQETAQVFARVKDIQPRDSRAAEGLANWNLIGPPSPGFQEQVYFLEIEPDREGWSRVVLADPNRELAASVRYDAASLPCFTLWKNSGGIQDGYVVGLEPGTNFPNPRKVEEDAGRVVWLEGGESVQTRLAIGLHLGQAEIEPLLLQS